MAQLLAVGGWLDPERLIATFGTIGLLLIIFAESGLLIGFFLPGDSLLFTAGLLASQGKLNFRGGPGRLRRRRHQRGPGRLYIWTSSRAGAVSAA